MAEFTLNLRIRVKARNISAALKKADYMAHLIRNHSEGVSIRPQYDAENGSHLITPSDVGNNEKKDFPNLLFLNYK